MNWFKLITFFVSTSALGFIEARGQAFCALRNPITSIQQMYPEATTYRSIVRTIDRDIRKTVAERLPPHTLHFGELGRHTLYVPMAGQRPLGLVHVRSEESKWGLIEIAWALDFELRIEGFLFQRCRDKTKSVLEEEGFQSQLKGKNFEELKQLWLADDGELDPRKWNIPESAKMLGNAVVRCGLKTILVTDLAWEEDIAGLKELNWIVAELNDAVKVEALNLQPADLILLQGDDFAVKQMQRVLDVEERGIGWLLWIDVQLPDGIVSTYWIVDSEMNLRRVGAVNAWPDKHVRLAFDQLAGSSIVKMEAEGCSGQAQILAKQCLMRVAHWLDLKEHH